MISEEVKKAAERYANDVCRGSHHRWGMEQVCMVDFIEGANWRVNASWHDAKETPQERRFCLYILKDGSYGCGYYHKRDNTIWYEQFENVEKWAYFDDLIPFLED